MYEHVCICFHKSNLKFSHTCVIKRTIYILAFLLSQKSPPKYIKGDLKLKLNSDILEKDYHCLSRSPQERAKLVRYFWKTVFS